MNPRRLTLAAKRASCGLALLLCACGQQPPPPEPAPPQGRVETRGIRNTEAIGAGGAAIANKVDRALDQNDAQKKKLDDALQQQAN